MREIWEGVKTITGRVFFLDLRHSSDVTFEVASSACEAQGAQVASAMDLRHAVVECSFSACARGWLSGHSIGTTVCRSVAGSLRAVDIQVENMTQMYEKLSVFCVKDTGAPCGFPPSFPNSHLQGHTGLELGDELLYACNPGYILPNRETGFSLLCDSCGEWYGLVHLCVKDTSEALVDYDDKLPDSRHPYDGMEEVHHVSLMPGTIGHGEEEESTPEPEQFGSEVVEEEASQINNASVKILAETPVSQLSQKHIFWFPSEAFQEEDHPFITTVMPIKGRTKDEAYIPVKADDSLSGPQITSEHHGDEYTTQHPTVNTVVSTVEAWLDGYPVAQEEEKAVTESRQGVGPMQGMGTGSVSNDSKVEDFGSVTDRPKETGMGEVVHIHQEKAIENMPKTSEEQVWRVTDKEEGSNTKGRGYEEGFHRPKVGYHEATDTPPGKIYDHDTSPSEEKYFVTGVEREAKRPLEVEHKKVGETSKELPFYGATDRPNDVDLNPTSSVGLTQVTNEVSDKTLENRPKSYKPSTAPKSVNTSLGAGIATPSVMAPYDTTPASVVHVISNATTITISIPWETKDYGHFVEKTPIVHHNVSVETHDNRSALEEDIDRSLDQQMKHEAEACSVDPCQIANHGPMIAATIVAIAAAMVGLALGVWCYRRRQQKTSHCQLNGTNRQTQCIELQQTV